MRRFRFPGCILLALALFPWRADGREVGPGPADEHSGLDLLRWRLLAQAALCHGDPETTGSIYAALITNSPEQHWLRTAVALEAHRLRKQEPLARRAISSAVVAGVLSAEASGTRLERAAWASEQLPYVEPLMLAELADDAKRRGDHQRALDWHLLQLELTPVSHHGFLEGVLSIAQLARNSKNAGPDAAAALHRLTGDSLQTQQRLSWFCERLECALIKPSNSRAASAELSQSLPTDRVALALDVYRTCAPIDLSSTALDRLWHSYEDRAEDPLDRADFLRRRAKHCFVLDRTDEGLECLLRARAVVPPGAVEIQILGELLVNLSRYQPESPELAVFVERLFVKPHQSFEDLLGSLDLCLDLLADRESKAPLNAVLAVLEDAFSDHPYAARVLEMRAAAHADNDESIRLYNVCLASPWCKQIVYDSPQLRSLFALSDLYQQSGDFAAAADALARALAVSPLPKPYQVRIYQQYARLFDLRLKAGEQPAQVIDDLFLVTNDGRAIGQRYAVEIHEILLQPFAREPDRELLKAAIAARQPLRTPPAEQHHERSFFELLLQSLEAPEEPEFNTTERRGTAEEQ